MQRHDLTPVPVWAAVFIGALLLSGCLGYVPGEKAYWDSKVDELCTKDGGLRILQKPNLSQEERAMLRSKNGKINIVVKNLAPPNVPIYAVLTQTYVKEGNPSISRSQVDYVRRTDGAIIATSVTYGRVGGDFPSHAHPSSYSCPDRRQHILERDKLDELFSVD